MTQTDYYFPNAWTIGETAWKPERQSNTATVFALANGYMGSRGAPEETDPAEPWLVGNYINGIYDTPQGKLTEREFVNIPDWHHVHIDVNGEPFDLNTGRVLEYRRELNMREGILRRSVTWESPGGTTATFAFERFLSVVRPNVACVLLRWSSEDAVDLDVSFCITPEVNNRWADHTGPSVTTAHQSGLQTLMRTRDPGYEIGIRTHVEAPAADLTCSVNPNSGGVCRSEARAAKSGEFVLLAAIHDSRFTDCRLDDACEATLDGAWALGYEALKDEHIARWAALWEESDVVIEGDEDAQIGIRFSLFHLLAAAPWWSDRVSVPARGLQGQDYYGSIFWDFEIFVFPFLAATQPLAARNGLGYRYHTLNGARRKANNFGFEGAFYAWQSQETGDDQCALYVFTNPLTGRPMRAPFSDQQIHISADISHALWQYWLNTGDDGFIREQGLEIACEVARFFASRADEDEAGIFHLRGVLGPDEYHEDVTDDAYTNALARRAFDIALRFHALLWERSPGAVKALAGKIHLTDHELADWKRVRDNLFIPPPREDGVIEQFEGYFDLEDAPEEIVRPRLKHPDLHPGGPEGPFQSTQLIKQADVVMMLYLLRDHYGSDVKRANWDYYQQRTVHDSSLSGAGYALVAAELGMVDEAYRFFIGTSHIDMMATGPHWNHGIHAASLGGAWLALVHGFCQVNQEPNAVLLRAWPTLPDGWQRVSFRLAHDAQRLRFTYEPDRIRVEHLGSWNGEDRPVTVRCPDGDSVLAPGANLTLDVGPSGG